MPSTYALQSTNASNLSNAFQLLGLEDKERRVLECAGATNHYDANCMSRWCTRCQVARAHYFKRRIEPLLTDEPTWFASVVWRNVDQPEKDALQAMRTAVRELCKEPVLKSAIGVLGALDLSYHPSWPSPFFLSSHLLIQGDLGIAKENGHKEWKEQLRMSWEKHGGLPDVYVQRAESRAHVLRYLEFLIRGMPSSTPPSAAAQIISAFDGVHSTVSLGSMRRNSK